MIPKNEELANEKSDGGDKGEGCGDDYPLE